MQKTSKFKKLAHRTIRLDMVPGKVADASAGAETRGVLEKFQTWIRSAPTERRQAARHSTGGGKLWLGWWDSNRVFSAVNTEVVNISRGGALVRAAESPHELREIWVCLDVMEPDDCVPASVLSVEPVHPGSWLVRIEFSAPCPHGFLATTVAGPAPRAVGPG